MEKVDITNVVDELNELKPTTEYAEFLSIWPQIENALERQNKRKDIWQLLVSKGHLTVSYVTFTRFVKKALEQNKNAGKQRVSGMTETIEKPATVIPGAAVTASEDNSNQDHQSEAAAALSHAQKVSTSTDYARIARQSSKKQN
jgi:hypothetical protein